MEFNPDALAQGAAELVSYVKELEESIGTLSARMEELEENQGGEGPGGSVPTVPTYADLPAVTGNLAIVEQLSRADPQDISDYMAQIGFPGESPAAHFEDIYAGPANTPETTLGVAPEIEYNPELVFYTDDPQIIARTPDGLLMVTLNTQGAQGGYNYSVMAFRLLLSDLTTPAQMYMYTWETGWSINTGSGFAPVDPAEISATGDLLLQVGDMPDGFSWADVVTGLIEYPAGLYAKIGGTWALVGAG